MRSLRARLAVQLLLALLVVFLLLWLVVSSTIRNVAENYIATRLGHDSEALLAALNLDADGKASIEATRIDSIYERPFSGHYYQVFVNDQDLRARALWDQVLLAAPPAGLAEDRRHLAGPQRQPLLLVYRHYRKQGRDVHILVAEDLTALEADITAFQNRFTLAAGLMLVLLIVLSIATVHLALRPLQRVRADLAALEQGRVDQLTVAVPEEIRPLVREVNRLLQLLHARLKRSRHAFGDLAHALKKPLTLLRQLDRDAAVIASPETRRMLNAQVDAIAQIIDRQLRRARLAGEGQPGVSFPAARELPPLIEVVRRLQPGRALQFTLDIPDDLRLNADREDMLELLGNLLDNAAKWAQRQVRLSIGKGEIQGTVLLRIEDDGPGIADEALAGISQRGKRLDESVDGHGLGLAIVRDIVADYGGELRFSRASLGGLAVEIRLPVLRHEGD